MVQWLRRHASTVGDMGLLPGWGTKILHEAHTWPKKKREGVLKKDAGQ